MKPTPLLSTRFPPPPPPPFQNINVQPVVASKEAAKPAEKPVYAKPSGSIKTPGKPPRPPGTPKRERQMTPEQAATRLFETVDKDNTGVASKAELIAALKSNVTLQRQLSPQMESSFSAFSSFIMQLRTENASAIKLDEWLDIVAAAAGAAFRTPRLMSYRLSMSPFDPRRVVDVVD